MDLDKAKERYKKLGESIKKFEQAQNKKERTKDTRKKILLGAAIMSVPDRYDKFIKSEFFDKYLTENRDRELFGLGPISEKEKPKNETLKNEVIKNELPDGEPAKIETAQPLRSGRFSITPDSSDL